MKEVRKTNVKLVTVALFVATFMSAVEGTIVATAMPTIVGTLQGIELMNWVFSIYLLTNAMMTPIYGKLTDRFGRKPVFMVGILIFIVGSSLCGFATSMPQLILFRAIQGIGAGSIFPISMIIIADIYPFEKRAKVLGLIGAAWGIAGIVGPLLGGFIVDFMSWHWIFFVNVPIGILTVLIISYYLIENVEHNPVPIDYAGSATLMVTILTLLYSFQIFGETGEISILSGSLLAIAIISLITFYNIEKRAVDPIIPLEILKNQSFVIPAIVATLVSGFLIGVEIYIPMWIQGVQGYNATMGGFALTPMSLTWIAGSFLAGSLMKKYSSKLITGMGVAVLIVGGTLLVLVPESMSYYLFWIITFIFGLGFGTALTTTTVIAQQVVPKDKIGVATALITLVRTLGQTIMIAIYGIGLNMYLTTATAAQADLGISKDMINTLINPTTAQDLKAEIIPVLRQILYTGLNIVFWLGLVTLIVAFLFNFLDKAKVHGKQKESE
ncbi:MAG: MDR family MFS transporter [Mycoplasmatales bacterium]